MQFCFFGPNCLFLEEKTWKKIAIVVWKPETDEFCV